MTAYFNFFSMGCLCGKESIDINGKTFTIKTRLGEGGFSVVDLLQDQKTHRYYALKRIACHSKEDEKNALREAEYHGMFNHPNIVECIDVSVAERVDKLHPSHSEVRLLLPYYRRGTLHDELTMRSKSKNHLSETRILRLFRQMCEGIRVMHNAQPHPLAHRDVKPSNVLLSNDDKPVWMDFGSMGKARQEIHKSSEARALQDLAAEKCSMAYRAPELFNVETHTSLDERVDVWSLGCCLYAMCYFKSPFEAAHERGDSVALAVVSGILDFPENSQYSSGIHNLIRTMLEVSALQRPFIDGVLLQIDSISPTAQDIV
ncbi:serine/threonine-protein kinase 16 [Parasteatoda tepidariorum]|uniref:serine/threonine-protein kinase 16 n=1 Tax=Parasteatoda tepidariorum TaxID=114398 RepID=UPI001C71E191|nr:serine/threonine-protein kinase 16 isoform X1 [Parasteatoda tepidariorum]XP_042898758.1 serine/threonine-protein kinase 16 isoform X1 [Parasteatoda tepidariorum]XP_042898759.1 serine/threonine-protein kinase 16 isoform X2 [Parasteatoda tepidariorum]XP_042898762.1 serine/threonine-protein kinase 16 isoform X2 [Parasteatoda tepidariorum]